MKRILISIPDLMFETRVTDVSRKLGHRVEPFSGENIGDAGLVIVALENNREWERVVQAARAQAVPVVAFGRHTSLELLRKAREAACTRVVVNSEIAQDFPQLLEELVLSPNH